MIDIQNNQVFFIDGNFYEEEEEGTEFSPQADAPEPNNVKVEEVSHSAAGFDTEDSHLIDY